MTLHLPKAWVFLIAALCIWGSVSILNWTLPTVFKTPPVIEVKSPAQPAAPPLCPAGWTDTSTRDGDAIVFSCSQGDHTVWLTGNKTFDHAFSGKKGEPILLDKPAWWPGQ